MKTSSTSPSECLQKKTIEIIRLPDLDLTQVNVERDTIRDAIMPQMEYEKFYVVSVDTSYVSGRKGNVRRKTTHYIARKSFFLNDDKTRKTDFCELSGYPTYAFGLPQRFFQ